MLNGANEMTEASGERVAQRDNMLGICHALGEDLGIDPIVLRLALGALLLVNLELPFILYGVLGLIVIATRLLVPARRLERGHAPVQLQPTRRESVAANDVVEHARAA